jgi:hypothetical protein
MKRLLAAATMLSAALVFAQEAEQPLDPPDESATPPASANKSAEGKEAPEPPATASQAKADPKRQSSPDVFVPSESISEDLAVPLPVDI